MTNILYDSINYYNETDNPIISEFLNHPTTDYLSSIVLFAACSLDVGPGAQVVAESSTVSIAEAIVNQNIDNLSVSSIIMKDQLFPQVTLAIPIVAVDYIGSGKVIAIPDTNLFANDTYSGTALIDVHDNEEFLINILYW
ncbi:MAG: hypothetical protein ACP5D6_08850 [Kosmotogaceae bacterium]